MSKKRKKDKFTKNFTVEPDNRIAKKEAVLGTRKKNRLPLIAVSVCALLAAGAGILLFKDSTPHPATGTITAPAPSGTAHIVHPIAMFEDGKARHFEYQTADLTIRYFVLKSSDGVLRAAFDACDVCWPAGKGYFQDGDVMVCRNCGRRFASVRVNEVKGGCNPAPLKRNILDGQVVLSIEDILQGQSYFNIKGRV